MNLARFTLWLGAATFGALGALLALAPQLLETWVGIRADSPAARTELRSFYGGLEIGLAAFLVACALRDDWVIPGCCGLAMICAGIALVRVVGFAIDGSVEGKLLGFLWTELLFVVLGTISVLRAR
jgi:hypothetical protein